MQATHIRAGIGRRVGGGRAGRAGDAQVPAACRNRPLVQGAADDAGPIGPDHVDVHPSLRHRIGRDLRHGAVDVVVGGDEGQRLALIPGFGQQLAGFGKVLVEPSAPESMP